MSKRLFIAGCGYSGSRVAAEGLQGGWQVTALLRDREKALPLEQIGVSTVLCNMDEPEQIPRFDLAGKVLLYSIPPQGGGNSDLRLKNFYDALERNNDYPSRIIYLGATSVYGATGSNRVDECYRPQPTGAMGKRRLDAEQQLTGFADRHNIPLVILRIAAIYGKGRLPMMQISQGQPLLRQELANLSSRIHVDDLLQVIMATLEQGEGIYNVSDGHPATMTEYFNLCADCLKLPRQPQVDLEEGRRVISPLLFNYFMESRNIDNSRMLNGLKIRLKYPDMLQGVAASV